jgi:hypothetical protein
VEEEAPLLMGLCCEDNFKGIDVMKSLLMKVLQGLECLFGQYIHVESRHGVGSFSA